VKTSELITELLHLMVEYGDLETLYLGEDGLSDITRIDFFDDKTDETPDPPGVFVIA